MFTHLDNFKPILRVLNKTNGNLDEVERCFFSVKTVLNDQIKLLFSEQISRFKKLFRSLKRRQKKFTQ